jgi:hypothetical protein
MMKPFPIMVTMGLLEYRIAKIMLMSRMNFLMWLGGMTKNAL